MGDDGVTMVGFWASTDGDPSSRTGGPQVVEFPSTVGTGVLPFQRLAEMVKSEEFASLTPIEADQIQPASLDLRLGRTAYEIKASFLPNSSNVMTKVGGLRVGKEIDLNTGAILQKGKVYIVQLMESIRLDKDTFGIANPKSSTGRLDVLTRLITDKGAAFDHIEKSYAGPLFIEIAPLTFNIVVRSGVRLNQIRLHRERGTAGGVLRKGQTDILYQDRQLVSPPRGETLLPLREGSLVPVTVDLNSAGLGSLIGYRAKSTTSPIDVSLIGHYDPREYWDRIESDGNGLNLEKDIFYILATREDVGVPPRTAAEMLPQDSRSGEFRVHYAGFFDPGFGWSADKGAFGSKAVLEVRSHGISFTLEHGQIIGWLRYSQIAGGETERL
jgi:dCTP deaminase